VDLLIPPEAALAGPIPTALLPLSTKVASTYGQRDLPVKQVLHFTLVVDKSLQPDVGHPQPPRSMGCPIGFYLFLKTYYGSRGESAHIIKGWLGTLSPAERPVWPSLIQNVPASCTSLPSEGAAEGGPVPVFICVCCTF
jgi:hypothetical protein